MNQGLIIFGIIILIIWIGVTIWVIFMIKRFVDKDNPLAGKLLEIDRSLLGKPFHPVRLFMFTKTFYPNKELSETMYIVEVIKKETKQALQGPNYMFYETQSTVFYRIDSETFKLFSECKCTEFRLISQVIKPGEDKLYFEAYSGMR